MPVIPLKSNRREDIPFSKREYEQRNVVVRCMNKFKQFRNISTRYDRQALAYMAFAKLATIRLSLRFYESTNYILVIRTVASGRLKISGRKVRPRPGPSRGET